MTGTSTYVLRDVMFTCRDRDGNEISEACTLHAAKFAAGVHLDEGHDEVLVFGHDDKLISRAEKTEYGTVRFRGMWAGEARYQGVVCDGR